MAAPVAQPGRARSEIAGQAGPGDRLPDRLQGLLEPGQLVLGRLVAERVGVGQVDQSELAWHHATGAPQHQGIELHLEQRLGLERLARDAAGLVVHDPDVAGRRDVHPVDVAAQPQPVQHYLDQFLAGGRFQPGRILQGEVVGDQPAGRVQPAGQLGLGGTGEQLGELGLVGQQLLPGRADRLLGPALGAVGGRQVEEPFQHRVHQGAAQRITARWLRQPIDAAEPVQQRAGLEVRRPGRRQRADHGHRQFRQLRCARQRWQVGCLLQFRCELRGVGHGVTIGAGTDRTEGHTPNPGVQAF